MTVSEDGMSLELAGVDEKSDEINIREYVSITTEVAVEVRNELLHIVIWIIAMMTP